MTKLSVYYDDNLVGIADSPDNEKFAFTYSDTWLDNNQAFPLSVSLPLRETPWPAQKAHPFFANLLPEGIARQVICQRLGVSVDNDVQLLKALGNDTAGAFRFVTDNSPLPVEHTERLPITVSDLNKWAKGAPAFISSADKLPRLSLAGAQHKIAVIKTPDGYAIPASHEASTHILKFNSERFAHLSANEFLITRLATHLGLHTADVQLIRVQDTPFLEVTRYDRQSAPAGVKRLHQEDFCQVFGISPHLKYESEGGVGIAEIAQELRSISFRPALDILQFVRWILFTALSGNADGHCKNLSILYSDNGPILAPFYDLVCTRAYEGIDPNHAMAIGNERNPDRLKPVHLQTLARDLHIRPKLIIREATQMLNIIDSAFDAASEELRTSVGFSPAPERVQRAVFKRVRALRRNMGV